MTATMRSGSTLLFLCGSILTADARLGANTNTNTNTSPRGLQSSLIPMRVVGNNGIPADVFPLGECQGDCDNDTECGEGLRCQQRSPGDFVPGCRGDINVETDYCVQATSEPTTAPTPVPDADVPEEVTMIPISTTEPTNVMTEATTTISPTEMITETASTVPPTDAMTAAVTTIAPTEVVTEATTTVSPTQAETMAATTMAPTEPETMAVTTADPTTVGPTDALTASPTTGATDGDIVVAVVVTPEGEEDVPRVFLDTVGNDGNFPSYPLTLCQGDCDVDEDCAGELVCFQRVMDETVPGCFGPGDFSIDYCIRPASTVSSAVEEPDQVPPGVAAGGALEISDSLPPTDPPNEE